MASHVFAGWRCSALALCGVGLTFAPLHLRAEMGTDASGNLVYIGAGGSTTQLNHPEIHTAAVSTSPSLVGSVVYGSLYFGNDPTNYYDPGYDPNYENYNADPVVISDTAMEFGAAGEVFPVASADFTDSTLTLASQIDHGSESFIQTFTDPLFVGATLTEVPGADTYPAGGDPSSPRRRNSQLTLR